MKLKKGKSNKTKSKKKSVEQVDDLILKRIAGGSIINHRPLFSNDGEILYVVWKQVIRAYSAQTGDFVKELEPASNKIVGITLSPENPDTIIGCTDNAELIHWNSQNGLITIKTKLILPENIELDGKIKTFHIIHYKFYPGKDVCNAAISFIVKRGNERDLWVELYDLTLGNRVMGNKIDKIKEDYHLDIVGNYGENIIVLGHNLYLYIISPKDGMKFLRHKTGSKEDTRYITCVAGHPELECVAVGDTSGRILVWKNLFQHPVKAMFHWHTLPVTDIAFSKSGGQMYSGGGECVLVQWLLTNHMNRSFLPRLPAPIKYLTVANQNIFLAVSTLDNGITILNAQKKKTAVIQNFTRSAAVSTKSLFPAGVTVDPRTNSLVLNSRTGHIQFYNTHTKSLLYNVSITAQNFLTQERDAVIINTEVTRVAINDDGMWMATMEERDDNISHIEVRLKFWHFDMEKQSFNLNTSVELPHEVGVNALKFKPKSSLGDLNRFVVTVGKDNKFKLWNIEESTSTEKKTNHWGCYSVGNYRNFSALDAGFSTDGSLVGVGFGSSLTLWVPETMEMKKCLSHSRYLQPITRVEFGKQELCHLVVTASTQHLAVWDLLSLTVKWSVPINLSILSADPLSTYMAAFTTDNTLFVFTPDNSEIVYSRKNILENDVSAMGACFVPNIEVDEDNLSVWQKKSQFYFLNSEQELLTLESKSESSIVLENLYSNRKLPLTAFNRIRAAEKISSVEKPLASSQDYVKANKGIVEEFFNAPAHTLPPMRILCAPFLLSLMGKSAKKRSDDKLQRIVDDVNEKDSDSEEETVKNKGDNHVDGNNVNKAEESSESCLRLDWSFLADVVPSNPPAYEAWNC